MLFRSVLWMQLYDELEKEKSGFSINYHLISMKSHALIESSVEVSLTVGKVSGDVNAGNVPLPLRHKIWLWYPSSNEKLDLKFEGERKHMHY